MDNISKLLKLLRDERKAHQLSRYPFNAGLPHKRGIYFVTTASGEILYLGMATSLSQRWRSHHKQAECERFNATYIYFWETDLNNISLTEAWLLSQLTTKLNVSGVRSKKKSSKPKASRANKPKRHKPKKVRKRRRKVSLLVKDIASSVATISTKKLQDNQKALRKIMGNF